MRRQGAHRTQGRRRRRVRETLSNCEGSLILPLAQVTLLRDVI